MRIVGGAAMADKGNGGEGYAWAGPALFTAVLAALAVFFWWFVRA